MSERHFVRAVPRRIGVLDSSAEGADAQAARQFVYLGRQPILDRGGALGTLLRVAEAAGEGADAASIAAGADAPPGFAALTPDVLAELNLSAAAWFGAHVEEVAA